MDEVIEINGLDNACRLCLTTEQTRSSIFGVPYLTVPFVDKIRNCLSIQVSNTDKLSTLVCVTCVKNINHWHSYKDTCFKAQEKLQQWLAKKNSTIPPMVKIEPMEIEHAGDDARVLTTNHVSVSNESKITERTTEKNLQSNEGSENNLTPNVQIKSEPLDTEDEDDFNLDVESVNGRGELLLNPMAVAAGNTPKERIMEADSTQKFNSKRLSGRKKNRRGPHTHYRGARIFKKKCIECNIFLHSKHSYQQHMSRYHGIINKTTSNQPPPALIPSTRKRIQSKITDQIKNEESSTQVLRNPEEAEFEQMIKTDPLTPVQRNIISQLKTFSCYSCDQTFFDRRHTLNHIRQHMTDLKSFTCIACFTEFSDRSMYKLHCGASFECAMKIALVIPRTGEEKYFTCNMCLKALSNRGELLNHLAIHSNKQHKQLNQPLRSPPKLKPINQMVTPSPAKKSINPITSTPTTAVSGPYMNGDPAYNFMCDLCGMIYRYKPNMFKHRDLCLTLPENIRTSYKCIHCNMTYLVFKKFYTHVFSEHKKREITCYTCHEKFPTPDDYLSHHESHRKEPIRSNYTMEVDPLNSSSHPTDVNEKPFHCALCDEDFASKVELTEHRNLHLKVKIYSCVICRSMFSSSAALEQHMKDHGIEDGEHNANNSCIDYNDYSQNSSLNDSAHSEPGGKFFCHECSRNFANWANLRRHQKNVHALWKEKSRFVCDKCKRWFKSMDDYNEHLRNDHGIINKQRSVQPYESVEIQGSPSIPQISATTGKPLMQCPKCPKMFAYQGNLIQHCQTIHKEDHYERIIAASVAATKASHLSQTTKVSRPPQVTRVSRPPTALTSRPHNHTCDICGKSFKEEQSLKVHRGWHLRSSYKLKSEKVDYNVSMDDRLLSNPSKNPGYTIMSADTPKPAKARKSFPNNPSQKQLNIVTAASLQCQVCDDRFVDVAELRKHLWDVHCARNKPEKSFAAELQCELCTNRFPDEESLKSHMKWHAQNPILSNNSNVDRIESVEEETNPKQFYCETCGKYYSNRKVFQRHKKLHKVLPAATVMNLQSLQSRTRHHCNTCQKNFSTEASLKRHKASQGHMNVVRSQMQVPPKKITTTALIHHPPPEPEVIKTEPDLLEHQMKKKSYTCSDCKTIFPNMSVLYQHRQLVHKVSTNKKNENDCIPLMSTEGLVCCNLCGKQFSGIPALKQHFTLKHKNKISFPCLSPGCKFVFSSASSLKNHETTHTSVIFNCRLCDKHVFSKLAMTKHMLLQHKAIYQSGATKSSLWTEMDLSNYTIKNCQGTACPKCKVKYPNLRALKIHYFKFHDKT